MSMVYYKIINEDGDSIETVAFDDSDTAQMVLEEWNIQYNSRYTLEKAEDASEAELLRGRLVIALL